ncbi:ROK family transcriptional regulator [Rugosimonospora acidiphila]|uniref:ROK family transcriptional regulator n=1 Tax=Rugosimonospora acidiphila TaxID=556531 RepID=A0ABP9RU58_9ACTN
MTTNLDPGGRTADLTAVPARRRTGRATGGQIMQALMRYGPMTRARLCEVTGLSRTTVWGLVSELLAEAAIVEGEGVAGPNGGRRASLLWVAPSTGAVIGIDFGRTHVRAVLADLTGAVLAQRASTVAEVDEFAEESLSVAVGFVNDMLAESGIGKDLVRQVVVGLPAPINRATGTFTQGRILNGWTGVVPREVLETRLGMPVAIENNANLGALAEARIGSASGAEDLVYVKLSSGVGAGLVLGGRLYRGAAGIAGEIGHILVDEDGAVCWCGSRGCLDTRVSGRRILELLQPTASVPLSLAAVVDLVKSGDPFARRIVSDAGRILGRAIADLCTNLNPGALVIGGVLSGCGDVLLQPIVESLNRYAQPATTAMMKVTVSALGTSAEVMGAACMATDLCRADLAG